MIIFKKILIWVIKLINYIGSGASIRLVKWTGKANQKIHPKHLIKEKPEYLKYFEPKDVVLDIGCANGQRDFRIASKAKKIVAFDYNEKLLRQAKEWQSKNKIHNIEFMRLSAEEALPFADNSFDKILFLDVLEHLYRRDQIMEECRRVLRPGGKLILSIPNSETSWKKFQKSAGMNYYSDLDHKIEYTQEEIINIHKKTGFSIDEIHPIVYDFCLNGIIDFIGGINLKIYKRLSSWKKSFAQKHPTETIGFMIISTK